MVDALGPNEIERIGLIDIGGVEEEIMRINQWLIGGSYKQSGKSSGWIVLSDHLTNFDRERLLQRYKSKWGASVHIRELTLWDKLPREQKIIAICILGLPFFVDALIRFFNLEKGHKKQYIIRFR